jgi:hypothetical protein
VTPFGMFGISSLDIDIDIDDGGQGHTTYGQRDAHNS